MEPIEYNVPVPRLRGMTEEQKDKALEDYMREQTRQLKMILRRLTEMTRNVQKALQATKQPEDMEVQDA